MSRQSHILNAASNLLGTALIILSALKVAHISSETGADEVAAISSFFLAASCLFAYLGLRQPSSSERMERLADIIFLPGLVALLAAVGLLVFGRS